MHHCGDAEHVRGGVRGAGADGGDPAAGPPPAQIEAPPPRQLRHLRGGERAVQGECRAKMMMSYILSEKMHRTVKFCKLVSKIPHGLPGSRAGLPVGPSEKSLQNILYK